MYIKCQIKISDIKFKKNCFEINNRLVYKIRFIKKCPNF